MLQPVEDCSLFIGLTTIQSSSHSSFFQEEFLNGIFKIYKENLEKYSFSLEDPNSVQEMLKTFYNPRGYCLFGEYDMSIISLIDDYALGSRSFRPYNSYLLPENHTSKNFNYQVITGSVPKIGDVPLREKAKTCLLNEKDRYPFIEIISLKLNNALLIGAGYQLITLVNRKIEAVIKIYQKKYNLDFIVLESFSWNELNLILFSNSLEALVEIIMELRQIRVEHLADVSIGNELTAILNDCLLRTVIDNDIRKNRENPKNFSLYSSHLFIDTPVYLGTDCDFVYGNNMNSFLEPVITEDNIRLFTKWTAKPGHTKHLSTALSRVFDKPAVPKISVLAGPGIDVYIGEPSSLKNLKTGAKDFESPDVKSHLRKFSTILEYKYDMLKLDSYHFEPDTHFPFHETLSSLIFDLNFLRKLNERLNSCNSTKILHQKILNMYVNYNDGITDPNLFGYFIELKEYLERIKDDLEVLYQTKSSHYQNLLEGYCNDFEIAYKNRFNQSKRMLNVTDFNLELNGGIQQLVSSYNSAYNTIVKRVLGNNPALLYVSGNSGVDSSRYTLRLNYFHIFQPEIFVSIAFHEALNYYSYEELDKQYETEKTADDILKTTDAYRRDYQFNTRHAEWEELAKIIGTQNSDMKIDLHRYFAVDLSTYYLGYNGNIRLFFNWHWFYFMQFGLAYNMDGTIKKEAFLTFLLRVLTVVHYVDPGFLEGQYYAPCKQLQDLWNQYYLSVKEFVSVLLRDSNIIRKELEDAKFSVAKILKKEEHFQREEMDSIITQHCALIADGESEVSNALKDGNIYEYLIDSDPFIYISRLFFSYLRMIDSENERLNPVLPRERTGVLPDFSKMLPDNLKDFGKVMADPLGGVFINQPRVKTKIFAWRGAFLKSLWDYSFKDRKQHFKKLSSN